LIKSSSLTNTRSVSDALPYPIIADLGSKHADCPILLTITIPELNLCHIKPFGIMLGVEGSKGFPEQQGVSQNLF